MGRNIRMQTFSGEYVRFDALDELPVSIVDIAHHLSQICRFGGATRRFYSVAQHSVRVSRLLKALEYDRAMQYEALHHDDTETYIGDMVKPLKIHNQHFNDVEQTVHLVIAADLSLRPELSHDTKMADLALLWNELETLLPYPGDKEHFPDWALSMAVHVAPAKPWSCRRAEREFLICHIELTQDDPLRWYHRAMLRVMPMSMVRDIAEAF